MKYKIGDVLALRGETSGQTFKIIAIQTGTDGIQEYVFQGYYADGSVTGDPFAVDVPQVDNFANWYLVGGVSSALKWAGIAAGVLIFGLVLMNARR